MKDIIHHGKCIKGFIYHLSQHRLLVIDHNVLTIILQVLSRDGDD